MFFAAITFACGCASLAHRVQTFSSYGKPGMSGGNSNVQHHATAYSLVSYDGTSKPGIVTRTLSREASKNVKSLSALLAAVSGTRPGRASRVGGAQRQPFRRYLRLRGGQADEVKNRELSQEEIHEKLSAVPTFVVVDESGGFLAFQDEQQDKTYDAIFFLDPAEAEEALQIASVSNSASEGLRLAVVQLGAALEACKKSQSQYKVQGPRGAYDDAKEEALEKLHAQGIEPGDWLLPVYCSDGFQSADMFPLFFSKEDLIAGWVRSGKPEDEAMFLTTTVMDIRSLLVNMEHTNAMPWPIFRFVSSPEAYKLANELTTSQ